MLPPMFMMTSEVLVINPVVGHAAPSKRGAETGDRGSVEAGTVVNIDNAHSGPSCGKIVLLIGTKAAQPGNGLRAVTVAVGIFFFKLRSRILNPLHNCLASINLSLPTDRCGAVKRAWSAGWGLAGLPFSS